MFKPIHRFIVLALAGRIARHIVDRAWPAGTWDTLCYDVAHDVFVQKSGGDDKLQWLVMPYEPAAQKKAD